ncbi:hypothetical protein WJX82_011506 [Trebouxia sp. C0006]
MQEIVDEYAARREQYNSVQSCQSAASDCEKWLLDKDVPVTKIVGILASSAPLTLAETDETLPTQQYPCSMSYVLTRGCIWALDDEYDDKRMITGTQHQLVKLGADGIILPDWALGQFKKLPESARLYLQDQITTQAFCFTNHQVPTISNHAASQ